MPTVKPGQARAPPCSFPSDSSATHKSSGFQGKLDTQLTVLISELFREQPQRRAHKCGLRVYGCQARPQHTARWICGLVFIFLKWNAHWKESWLQINAVCYVTSKQDVNDLFRSPLLIGCCFRVHSCPFHALTFATWWRHLKLQIHIVGIWIKSSAGWL